MNYLTQNDKQNLLIILHWPSCNLESLFETLSEDDRQYASELMSYYSEWLSNQSSDALKMIEDRLGSPSQWIESRTVLESIMKRN